MWERDGGRCAFVGRNGWRCEERQYLEYHHLTPWIVGGAPTVVNVALRCRAHNQYEAKVYFAPIRRAMDANGSSSATIASWPSAAASAARSGSRRT